MLSVVVACGLAAGCKQQVFLDKQCFDQATATLPPPSIETDYSLGDTPLFGTVKDPATLNDPDRPARHLTLREALAIALENGSISDNNGGQITGIVSDLLPQFSTGAGFNAQTDRVKALALNPAIAGANLEASLSRFDAQWVTAMNWTTTDNIQQGLASFQNGNTSNISTSIVKGFAAGGVGSVNFTNNYRQLNGNVPNAISPLYESRLEFGFEQPLWRDYGTDINQVLARFPSFNGTGAASAAASYNARQNAGNILGVGTEGILISRIRIDQQRAEFERRIHNMLINVEASYWRLYQAYGRLYSFEEVLRIAHRSWLTNHAKFVAGTIGPANYYPIRGQYEEFRGERMSALGSVLQAERNLRGLIGIPVEDGTRLVPIDTPTMAPYQPNWEASVQMALMQKPELAIARDNLRAAQFTMVSQKNFLKPDLRFVARYSPVGFGTRLDGNGSLNDGAGIPRTDNALRSLAGADYNDWNLGLQLSMPLGFRMEHAAVRVTRLQLAQSYYLLQDSEQRVVRALSGDYQKMAEWYNLIEARRAERKAYADSVEARFREFAVGKTTVADFLLEAQRRLATAQVKEYEAIAEYNIALASFEYRKGNILKHNNVMIAEGPLPACAEVRAVEHEQERSKARILRERAAPIQTPGRLVNGVNDLPARLEVPAEVSQQMAAPNSSAINPQANPPLQPVSSNPLPANPGPASVPTTSALPANAMPTFRSVPTTTSAVPTAQERTVAASAPQIMDRAAPISSQAASGFMATTPGRTN